MGDLATIKNGKIAGLTPAALAKVRRLEKAASEQPQVSIETQHVFHAGMYSRTVMVPAGHMITGALIKIPTILIICGDAVMAGPLGSERITGYQVFSASARRKQALVAISDTYLTMLFPTQAETVEEAEREFTDEFDRLITRKDESCPA